MRTMKRNRQNVYIAHRIVVEENKSRKRYEKPFHFRENLSPVDSESEVKEYGERHFSMFKSIVDRKKWEKKISVEDAVYIDASFKDESENTYGINADYKVESIRPTLNTLTIYFEKK